MSLPQLIGLACVRCRKGIASVLEGAFCNECGNPIHHKCADISAEARPERCQRCGGDPHNRIAKEVRGIRNAIAEAAATGGPVVYPVIKGCPACGCETFTRVHPQTPIAFIWDRVCSECGMRYTPPTPIWAGFLMIFVGLLLLSLGGMAIARFALGGGGIIGGAFIGVIGVSAIILGIRALADKMYY